jgi:hypothetical protein
VNDPRVKDATVSLEASSNVSVINVDEDTSVVRGDSGEALASSQVFDNQKHIEKQCTTFWKKELVVMLERLDLGKFQKQGRIKIGAPQPKGHKSRSSSVPVRSGKTLPRISEWSSLERFPISTVSILKTSASTRNTQEKKAFNTSFINL